MAGSVVPEAPVENPLAAMSIGYGQSKLAAEGYLLAAQREAALDIEMHHSK